MGGCLSAHKRTQKGRKKFSDATPTQHIILKDCIEVKDEASWVTKNGIGRFMQTEQGIVVRTRRINDDNGLQPKHNHDPPETVQRIAQINDGNYQQLNHNHDPQGSFDASKDEVWFDSHIWLDSDSDEDFNSVNGDSLPATGNSLSQPGSAEGTPRPTFASLKERMQNLELIVTPHSGPQIMAASPAVKKTLGEFFQYKLSPEEDLKLRSDLQHLTAEGDLQDKRLQKSCLPRLLPSVSFNDKKAPISPSAHKIKSTLLRFSFKRRLNDFHESPDPFASDRIIERPIAGSEVPFDPADRSREGCWSVVNPATFKLRGHTYPRDKKKNTVEHAMYEPFGVDLFLSPKKINHIARYVELPLCHANGKLPSLLILNIQIPMYPATIFLNEADGEGLNLVLYHKLSESYSKVPSYFQDMFMKIIDDGTERVRRFAADYMVPFRERLKILGRVVNPEELHLSVAERKLVYTYNEKPVLSRPQHSFYQCENYLEVDLDMHRFSYLARKRVEVFRERLKLCILDLGLTIQGNRSDELPEQVLCCVRINKIDFSTCKQLATTMPSHVKSGESGLTAVNGANGYY